MKEKLVLIGAGSASFTRGLIADIMSTGWECDVGLVDIDPEALKVAQQLSQRMVDREKARITITASTDRREILPGATAIIATIGVGGRRGWEQDVFIPRKYGIFQPVGDSVMPGGASRSLRMIPAMVDIARDIGDLAPNALFFNYGNPMTAVTRGIRKATGLPVVGLCHGVMDVARYLQQLLNIDKKGFSYTAVGLNHLTWFTELYEFGHDVTSRMREYAAKATAKGSVFADIAVTDEHSGITVKGAPFSWQLCHQFGAFPSAMDRHVVEFFPHLFPGGRYLGKTLGKDIISFEETIRNGDVGYEEMKDIALNGKEIPEHYFRHGEGEHEQVLEIISSIRNDSGKVFSANLPNQGQIPNLPLGAILETPARAAGGGLRAITMPPLSSGIVGTIATRLQYVETIVEAALEGSRDKFIQALVLDGAVQTLDTAAAMADDFLKVHAANLPQFKR